MITTIDEFETALGRMLQLLADPPAPGTPEDAEFDRMLADLKAYRETLPAPVQAEHPAAPGLDRLQAELQDFQRRNPDHPRTGAMSGFAFGRDLS